MRAQAIAVYVTGAILAGSGTFAVPVWAQNVAPTPAIQNASIKPIGKVVSIKGVASIAHADAVVVQASLGNQPSQTKVGDAIYLGDVIQTGPDGKLAITFTDGTAFDLSSNARMIMNEFVYDPKSTSNSTLLSLTKGTFTFVAGKVAKTGDMRIETPVGTIGIRGTTPHVEISEDGSVKFSTLIEAGKEKVEKTLGVTPPGSSAPAQREKLNLNICRGC
jgi:hypothetical protein